ncbi:acetyltransferase-like isoleucine patch superfamily enzyme [Cohnella lupini]|uniref:Acetyltransferase-like isoleucine patch superfamily enzyme n=1 Tax=Cohnella lupini TaxID=1294267 RepID=A0A3D9I7F5_9BACL|nr:CatB-related O-acetyltransferase [Cohnella lupini]RED57575.1 acetyltransferase-like isoleucine patch superfamily enzyme [Cohnella lupini]
MALFGAGKAGQLAFFALKTLGISVEYFIDNALNKQGTQLFGVPVYRFQSLIENRGCGVLVLIATMSYAEIEKQLIDNGFTVEDEFLTLSLSRPIETLYDPMKDFTKARVINGVEIGRYTYGFERLITHGRIKSIGSFSSVNVFATGGVNHIMDYITTSPIFHFASGELIHESTNYGNMLGFISRDHVVPAEEVTDNEKSSIGHDVWIGTNVVILPGVKIGNGAIIGAGAVVTKDIPDYTVAVGVPARVIRYRFSSEEIEKLNRIQWWNWPEEQINEHAKLFMNNREFINNFSKE